MIKHNKFTYSSLFLLISTVFFSFSFPGFATSLKEQFSGNIVHQGIPAFIRPLDIADEESLKELDSKDNEFIRFFSNRSGDLPNAQISFTNYKLTNSFNLADYYSCNNFFIITKDLKIERQTVQGLTSRIYLGLFSESEYPELIAVVSIGKEFPNCLELSIKVFKKHQKMGWGKVFLDFIRDKFEHLYPEIMLIMKINIKNIPSLKLAKTLSFFPYGIERKDSLKESNLSNLLLSYPMPLTYDKYFNNVKDDNSVFGDYYRNEKPESLGISDTVLNSKKEFLEIIDNTNISYAEKIKKLNQLYCGEAIDRNDGEQLLNKDNTKITKINYTTTQVVLPEPTTGDTYHPEKEAEIEREREVVPSKIVPPLLLVVESEVPQSASMADLELKESGESIEAPTLLSSPNTPHTSSGWRKEDKVGKYERSYRSKTKSRRRLDPCKVRL